MMLLPVIIIILLVGIDQWIKFSVVNQIDLGEQINLIPNFFSLTYVQNNGAAWSILEGKMWFFYIITVIALGFGIYFLFKYRHSSKLMTIGIALAIAGGLGNFIDRLRLAFVVDMFQLDFINFPIFNFADSCLVVGVLLICIYLWKFDEN
ncbi:signal peptidase II [Enterococcus sp. MMGLQ5-2]|nr:MULTISPECIES: signal peptidase II [unclassified Enterococcus]MBS7576656.1 signal peptidase II [Enterococcus sp. MMGLQ5-2]MBS7583857.1 signal peptidase II [Enterococcus sp. MMGLQ5-1]